MHNWRRIEADGVEWEVRVVSEPERQGEDREILEFRALGEAQQPRRVAAPRDSLQNMSDEELASLHRTARPIGGDHYGRPGKTMDDVRS